MNARINACTNAIIDIKFNDVKLTVCGFYSPAERANFDPPYPGCESELSIDGIYVNDGEDDIQMVLGDKEIDQISTMALAKFEGRDY